MEDVNFIERYVLSNYVYKEFESIKKSNDLFKHQTLISSLFGNIYSNLDEVLIFHEMGVGKTCTAVRIAERVLNLYSFEYKGVIVITRGQSLISNFINEIANKCTDGKYINHDVKHMMSDKTKQTRTRRNVGEFYTFFTFELFAKYIKDLPLSTLTQRFENHIIIIDEVHNIRHVDNNTHLKIYDEIHKFLHSLRHRKIILLSGTPIRDSCEEIANVMNLILPLDRQMPTGNQFNQTFFNSQGDCINIDLFKSFFKNRISFLKSQSSGSVEKRFVGQVVAPLTKLHLVCLPMSAHQNRYYEQAWRLDSENINIYSNVRQASLFVDSRGAYGRQTNVRRGDLDSVQDFSCKYAYLIARLNEANDRGELSMVYCDFIHGSGLFTLVRLLEQAGYTQQLHQTKSFILLTSRTSDARKEHLIDLFNQTRNAHGRVASVLIGSRVIAEGFTLKNVIHEHILTPHWNYSETSQVIARGWRNSHNDLIEEGHRPVLNIYQYAAVPTSFPSIDVIMYKTSEDKDIRTQKLVYLMKQAAIDCYLQKERNEEGVDFSRDCQYLECRFRCDDESCTPFTDYSNFDLFYYASGSDMWRQHLDFFEAYFRDNWCVTWQELEEIRSQLEMTSMQLVKMVLHLSQFHIFVNPRGNYSHCQYDDMGVFLVCLYDHRRPYFYNYLFSKYETASSTRPFPALALQHYMTDLETTLKQLVVKPTLSAVINAPKIIQKVILQHVIRLHSRKSKEYLALQRVVMNHFKLSIFESDTLMGFKLVDDSWCIDKSTLRPVDTAEVVSHFKNLKRKLETNEFGCYGQENRNMDEFCIKMIEAVDGYDKRKIRSGRRCVNWHKNDLYNLLTNQLKVKLPSDKMSRVELCQVLRQFFQKRQLIEDDETCGTQYKRKSGIDDEA